MYKAPVEDYKFLFENVLHLEDLMKQLNIAEVNNDLAEAVLEEAGKVAADIIAPLNHPGDVGGAKPREWGRKNA